MSNLYSIRNIIKVPSTELIDSKLSLTIEKEELLEEGWIVGLASSYVIRTIDKIAKTNYSETYVRKLKKQLTVLAKDKINKTNRTAYVETKTKLDEMLFMKHLVCVKIDKAKHYDAINKGFSINGIRYKRFLSTPASIKKGEVFYVNMDIIDELQRMVDNGHTPQEFVPAKLSAYRSLTMSASNPVSNTPNVCVVHDVEVDITTSVIELGEVVNGGPKKSVVENYTMGLNASDGFGFIDPTFAKTWANDLHLDYVPSCFIVRNSFLKGVSLVFDFKLFAKERAKSNTITDVWGKVWEIDEVDLVVTTSMLKLWNCYSSWEHYYNNCIKNGYTFSVTKQTPNVLDEVRDTNYQFIQSLNLTDEEIIGLIQPTIDEIVEVKGLDPRKSLAYLKGIGLTENSDIHTYDYVSALMIEPQVINDPFVRTSINNMIKKRIDDTKIGKIKVRGNYQTITIDPVCLAEHMFGMEVKGLLKAGEFYSKFWSDKSVQEVGLFRAPMVSHNNIGKGRIVATEEMQKWYQHIGEMIVFNAYDATCARLSGADCDGDTAFTTDNHFIMKGIRDTLPVVCLQKSANKQMCEEEDFIKSDKLLLASKTENVGVITNKATCIQSVQAKFEYGTPEWDELDYRIMASILHSQESIDVAKGIETSGGIPKSWISYQPNLPHEGDTEEVLSMKRFNRSLVADKKPYFFIYIYPRLRKEYSDFVKYENVRCRRKYKKTIQEILDSEHKTEEEEKSCSYFKKQLPIDETPCLMNKICWHVEKVFGQIKLDNRKTEFNKELLKSPNVQYGRTMARKIESIYNSYIGSLQKFYQTVLKDKITSMERAQVELRMANKFKDDLMEVCNNEEVLCNILIDVCYGSSKSRYVVWSVCGEQIIRNLLQRKSGQISYPIQSVEGEFEFKGIPFAMHTKKSKLFGEVVEYENDF